MSKVVTKPLFKATEQPLLVAARIPDLKMRAKYLAGIAADKMRFYCPNGANESYIRTVARSTEKTKIPVVLSTCANGIGKTDATTHIVLNFVYGPQSGWFDFPLFHNYPFPKKIWWCSTAEALRDTIEPLIDSIVLPTLRPEKAYTTDKMGKSIVARMRFPNGWEIYFKTYNQQVGVFESSTVGLLVLDEPAPEYIWKAVKSRRRMGCLTLYPNTPLYCPPYVIDEIQKAADEDRPGYFHETASVYEACQLRGIRGHLDPTIVDDMVASYDLEEVQARAFGRFMYFEGLIYPSLDRKKHLVDPEDFPIEKFANIYQIVDPHDSRPSAAIWGAINPNGRRIIFDESPDDKSRPFWTMKRLQDTDDEVKDWVAKETVYRDRGDFKSVRRILDRHFGWQTRGQKTLAELYLSAGTKIGKNFNYDPSYSSNDEDGELVYGHRMVRECLKDMDDGHPGLVIWNTCHHTWTGMSHYIKKRLTNSLLEDKAEADGKIVEKYKDLPDCVRYFVCSGEQAKVPNSPKSYSQKLYEEVISGDDYSSGGYQ